MSDLLTTKQVQNLLQVNRITIYRMLKDGRLSGIKVGHQWRFSTQQVEALLKGASLQKPASKATDSSLPIYCFQSMQDIFADMAQVGVITVTHDGTPLTQINNNNQLCEMILGSKTGYQACQKSWQKLAAQNTDQTLFATCHAGLQCISTTIKPSDTVTATLIAGQFHTRAARSTNKTPQIEKLAQEYGLDKKALTDAAQDVIILNERQETEIRHWLTKLASALEHISRERTNLTNRLHHIAHISDLQNEPITSLVNAGD